MIYNVEYWEFEKTFDGLVDYLCKIKADSKEDAVNKIRALHPRARKIKVI